MSSEDERVAWLREQIEGDRDLAARVASRYVAAPDSSRAGEVIWPTTVIERAWKEYDDPKVRAGLDFVGTYSPHAMLLDCEAKLGLIDIWADADDRRCPLPEGVQDGRDDDEQMRDDAIAETLDDVLESIASGYQLRAGYDEHWGHG